MPVAVHRQNTDFQLRNFIAGQHYTPDGAWAALYNQHVDIEGKLKHAEAQRLRREAALKKAQAIIDNPKADESDKLEAQADIVEQQASYETWQKNVEGAQAELDAINGLMEELEPLRKYSDRGPIEAAELAQRDEWREELKCRAENFMLSARTGIPWDHLQTMRSHPDFNEQILPHLHKIGDKLDQAYYNQNNKYIDQIFDKPALFNDEDQ